MGLFGKLLRPSQPAPAPASVPRFRRGTFHTQPLGQDRAIAFRPGHPPFAVADWAVDFALGCDRFRPLEKHFSEYLHQRSWSPDQVRALRSAIPELIENGVLISDADIARWLADGPAEPPPPPLDLCVLPTGGPRVEILSRAIRSFAANARAHGRALEFAVADSSADPAHRAAFRAALPALARETGLPIRYSGEEEKRAFAAALVARGCDPAAVEFAFFDPLNVGFACGANRNAHLLIGRGRRMASLDDDVVCRLSAPADATSARLKLYSGDDPFCRRQFPSRQAALDATPEIAADYFAAHENALGLPLTAFATGAETLALAPARDGIVRRLGFGSARVRATFAGHLGDPGIPTSVYYLYYDGDNRRRLTAGEEHYRAALASRAVFTTVETLAVGDASVCPGMAMGWDHRELLPPFFPVLHAEDFSWGAALWQCDPRAVLGHLPLAIHHDPAPGKHILQPHELTEENPVVLFEWAHLLRRLLLRLPLPDAATTTERMDRLGRYLSDIAALPEPDWNELLACEVTAHESEKLGWLESTLASDDESPDFWRDDVAAYIEHVRAALTRPDFDIPLDLKKFGPPSEVRPLMRRLLGEYGRLLCAWPHIHAASAGLEQTLAARL